MTGRCRPNLWPHPFRLAQLPSTSSRSSRFIGCAGNTFCARRSRPYTLSRLRCCARSNAVLPQWSASMMLPQVTMSAALSLLLSCTHQVGSPLICSQLVRRIRTRYYCSQQHPEEYATQRRVNRCGEIRIMVSVVARLARPAIAAWRSLVSCLLQKALRPLLYTGENQQRLDAVGRPRAVPEHVPGGTSRSPRRSPSWRRSSPSSSPPRRRPWRAWERLSGQGMKGAS